jgi:hypothetical protein
VEAGSPTGISTVCGTKRRQYKEVRMQEKHALRYATRDELLRSFGFRSYKQYLKSDEWSKIRGEVFAEYSDCICCEHKAQVVHHVRYDSATLLGVHRLHLAPLCHKCHEAIEIQDDGEKGSMARANTLMFEMARRKDAKQTWLQRFYKERKPWKSKSGVDAGAKKSAWRRKQEEKTEAPRDYSGVFWIKARRR